MLHAIGRTDTRIIFVGRRALSKESRRSLSGLARGCEYLFSRADAVRRRAARGGPRPMLQRATRGQSPHPKRHGAGARVGGAGRAKARKKKSLSFRIVLSSSSAREARG